MDASLQVLLPSPLLGPAAWSRVRDVLVAGGHDVLVPDVPAEPRWAAVRDGWLAQLPADRPLVLVPHSNAGLYVGVLAAARTVVATIFADAGLPAGRRPLAPPGLLALVAPLADDRGLLPPWTRWWPSLDGVFPDDESRAAVEAGEPRVPLAALREVVDAGDPPTPAAYLAFGDTYAGELAEARVRGWPTEVIDGGHLHTLADPAAVAAAVVRLAASARR